MSFLADEDEKRFPGDRDDDDDDDDDDDSPCPTIDFVPEVLRQTPSEDLCDGNEPVSFSLERLKYLFSFYVPSRRTSNCVLYFHLRTKEYYKNTRQPVTIRC